VIGVVAVVIVFVGIGLVVKVVNTRHRPEGAAEHWLEAVSDTTRNGVKTDGRTRAAKDGPHVSYVALVPADTGGRAAFDDLEVGKAAISGDTARVPYEAHQHNGHLIQGTLTLHRQRNGGWLVSAVGPRRPGELVPSQGGAAPSKVGAPAWAGALVLALLMCVVCSGLVRLSGPSVEAPAGGA
jgi:hypothetical protein